MTPDYLNRVRTLFEAALAEDPSRRQEFLARECHGDHALRREVDLLLSAREHVPDWLNQPVLAPTAAAAFPADPLARMAGRELGGYKLVREIGRGGMGTVFLAERSDGAFVKQVAVKLIPPGANNSDLLARFRQERQILASLDHPGIARLLDAGTTEEGLPYFVMEFVDGLPINKWCDERKLNVTGRLELFRHVFDAVEYAHQRLVVHRDLKPGNILVTNDGTVKLLDFGIAKLLHPETPGDETATLMPAMTPEYASPEQLKGDSINTLSDVYSLGVVLYELLTGHRPHHVLRAAMREMARVRSEEEPLRPSVAVTTTEERLTPQTVSAVREGDPDRLRKRLQGDLDWILLTALHAEPARRYRSVESFAEDLGRHLENRPVVAREDSTRYRLGRFIRRHPSGVAAGAVVILSLVAGIFTTVWESRIAMSVARAAPSGRTLLAPQWALFLYVAVALFGISLLLTRARLRRAGGALVGGAFYAVAWLLRMNIGIGMGWWQSRFSDRSGTLELFAQPVFLLTLAFAGAAIFMVSWRVERRFGWLWQVMLLFALGLYQAVRERIWFDKLMHILAGTSAIGPLVSDAVLITAALAVGCAAMRLVSGSAAQDSPLRTPSRRVFHATY